MALIYGQFWNPSDLDSSPQAMSKWVEAAEADFDTLFQVSDTATDKLVEDDDADDKDADEDGDDDTLTLCDEDLTECEMLLQDLGSDTEPL
jgi:hypothetical protein